jgi:phosphatidylglycerophosphatase A
MVRFFMCIATGFYVGYLPWAPGTWGSLLALPLHFFLSRLQPVQYVAFLAALLVLAVAAAGAAEKIVDRKDPGIVVIDEVAGMLVTMIGAPRTVPAYVAAFVLFRFFDILKPFPVNWVDRHLNGGVGIVADDLVAGLYALLCLQLLLRLLPM